MLFWISKSLQVFVYPFNLALIALALCAVAHWWRRPRWGCVLAMAALVLLTIPGIPMFAGLGAWQLEGTHRARPIADYPKVDAIVVLGGTTLAGNTVGILPEEVGGARLLMACRLYRAGKAPRIVCSGGLPFPSGQPGERSEAEDMASILRDMGIPANAIAVETKSRTTYENAVETAGLLHELHAERILLVSSALHLPRAADLFLKQGLEVTPVPCSQSVRDFEWSLRQFWPSPRGLDATNAVIKEWIGWLAYRAMGKL